MPSVFHCSSTNSTKFTTCCETAILDHEQRCPRCERDVYPFYEGMSESDRKQAAAGYYNHNTAMARDAAARRGRNG
jgi:hypothetical protein